MLTPYRGMVEIEMDDIPTKSNKGPMLLPPVKVARHCQRPPYWVITIGMLIVGGLLLLSMVRQSVDDSSSPTNNTPEVTVNTNSDLAKPLKRTHRIDTLGNTNLTHFDEHGRIDFDTFKQSVSDFVNMIKSIENLLTAYPLTQRIMARRELMRIIYQFEYDVHNGIKDLRNLQAKL